ncbi:alcohol oxidase [Dichomitus squalens LYAD-421 SS1]|uniref:Alcohol oxidase n=1 Tax=Dichomitus squalens (strain LYAD-421) TaxID=732165 RepID=R7SX80_DICSQ|nr:alcohol oxidase [Dichomitus squalens LYAD-421 SS1]EJF60335.1 alcohol oxidase [Dichomitus squalens LYAD-421 SS1]
MTVVPELKPQDVGVAIPIAPQISPETYTYDYIIVGGGTAGSVLASRLSEDPSVSVLVIERGPVADTWASRVPLLSSNIFDKDGPIRTWWSLPMRNANNRFAQIMSSEALGGVSRINGLLYTRGTPGDYNQWKALGNPGWGYENLEPYFVKSEKTSSHPASKFRGHDGVWQNRTSKDPYHTNQYIVRALQKAGIEQVPDLNAPDAPAACVGRTDHIVDNDHNRSSTNRAFLSPQLTQERKSRLKICTSTLVTRIELVGLGDELRAVGVHFEANDPRLARQQYFSRARREVVLCAGALASPQILMLSGLGPEEHLRQKGIPVVRDLPAVGGHLQDHVGLPIMFEVPMRDSVHQLQTNPLKAAVEFGKYLVAGRGILSHPLELMSTFVPTRLLDEDLSLSTNDARELDASIPKNRPDIEFMHIPSNSTQYDIPGKGIFTLNTVLIRPKSEGTVRLQTSNPRARPDVDLGFFTSPDDLVPLRKGVRLAMRIADDVVKQGYPLKHLLVPDGKTEDDIDRFIRANAATSWHYTSTCRMGQETHGSQESVVDAELKVHGVQGLRVCDASVFPEIIGSHTMAPAVVVAEKCAAMMRGQVQ